MKHLIAASTVLWGLAAAPAMASSIPPLESIGYLDMIYTFGVGATSVDCMVIPGWSVGAMSSMAPSDLSFMNYQINSAARLTGRLWDAGKLQVGLTVAMGETTFLRGAPVPGAPEVTVFPLWLQTAAILDYTLFDKGPLSLNVRGMAGPSVSVSDKLIRYIPIMPNAEVAIGFHDPKRRGNRAVAELVFGGGSLIACRTIF